MQYKLLPFLQHIVIIVKQNTVIRHVVSRNNEKNITNNKMSKSAVFVSIHATHQQADTLFKKQSLMGWKYWFLFAFSRALYYLCTINILKHYTK